MFKRYIESIKIVEIINILVSAYISFILSLSRKRNLFIVTLIFGLFLAAPIGYYILPLRYILVIFLFIFLFVFINKYKDVFYLFIFLSFLITLNVYSYYILEENFDFTYFVPYLIIFIGYILSKENLFVDLKPYVKFILIVNLFFLINEKITGILFVPFRDVNLMIYGQGIFAYTKSAADAVGLAILLFRKDFFWKFIILFSVLLIGVRSSIVFVILIILIDLILSNKHILRITLKKIFIGILFLIFGIIFYYFLEDLFYFGRIEGLFISNSATYTSRFYFAFQHLNCFSNLDIFQVLFGSGTYCPSVVENGSENIHIMFFTHFGIVHYSIWLIFLLSLFFRNINKHFYMVYPIGLYLLLGLGVRWGIGWMGGIILYTYLFNIYFKRKVIV